MDFRGGGPVSRAGTLWPDARGPVGDATLWPDVAGVNRDPRGPGDDYHVPPRPRAPLPPANPDLWDIPGPSQPPGAPIPIGLPSVPFWPWSPDERGPAGDVIEAETIPVPHPQPGPPPPPPPPDSFPNIPGHDGRNQGGGKRGGIGLPPASPGGPGHPDPPPNDPNGFGFNGLSLDYDFGNSLPSVGTMSDLPGRPQRPGANFADIYGGMY